MMRARSVPGTASAPSYADSPTSAHSLAAALDSPTRYTSRINYLELHVLRKKGVKSSTLIARVWFFIRILKIFVMPHRQIIEFLRILNKEKKENFKNFDTYKEY